MAGRKSGVEGGGDLPRKLPSFGTALAREIKHALALHGQWWFGRMAERFRAPLVNWPQTNTNRTLHNRTNFLRNSLHHRVEGAKLRNIRLRLWSDAPYARLQEYGGIVRPKRSRYLAIPIDDNLTPAGARRYSSPTDPEIVDGRFIRLPSGLYFVKNTGSGRLIPGTGRRQRDTEFLFRLVRQAEIPGPLAPTKRRPSRLGMHDTALNTRARKLLRRRITVAQKRAAEKAFGGVGRFKGGSRG